VILCPLSLSLPVDAGPLAVRPLRLVVRVAPGRRRCMLPKKTLSTPTVTALHLASRPSLPPAPALDVARAAYPVFLYFLPLPLLGRHQPPSVQTTLLPGSPSALLDTRPPAHYHPDHPGPDSFDPPATLAVPPPCRLLSSHSILYLPLLPRQVPGCACICVLAFASTFTSKSPSIPPAPPLHSTGPTLNASRPRTTALPCPKHKHRFHALRLGLCAPFLVPPSSQLLRRSSLLALLHPRQCLLQQCPQ
jgi:hypothetical protein